MYTNSSSLGPAGAWHLWVSSHYTDFATTCTYAPVIYCQGWWLMKPSNMQTEITRPPWTDASRNTLYVMDVIQLLRVLLGWHLFIGSMSFFSDPSPYNCRHLTLLLCTAQNRMATSHIPDVAKRRFKNLKNTINLAPLCSNKTSVHTQMKSMKWGL